MGVYGCGLVHSVMFAFRGQQVGLCAVQLFVKYSVGIAIITAKIQEASIRVKSAIWLAPFSGPSPPRGGGGPGDEATIWLLHNQTPGLQKWVAL